MPLTVPAPSKPIRAHAEPLTKEAFAPFGTAISNPSDPSAAISANQGSALKYVDVSPLLNFYDQSPSQEKSSAAMNMFVCSTRQLEDSKDGKTREFKVEILERHPFTTQTFSPLGLSKDDATKFLVLVAPSLPLSERDIGMAVPWSSGNTGVKLPGRGLPDLSKIKAFLADGNQAVTYAAGTWHAPMVVLGEKEVPFVVTQFVNGVGEEDCQEVVWEGDVKVSVPMPKKMRRAEKSKRTKEMKEGNSGLWTLKTEGIESVVTDRLGENGKIAIHGGMDGKAKL